MPPPDASIDQTLRHLVQQQQRLREEVEEARSVTLELNETQAEMHRALISFTPEQVEYLRRAKESGVLADAERYEKRLDRAVKWGGWVWGAMAFVGLIFSAGVAYAVFLGANATDAEVHEYLRQTVSDHNGGNHPDAIDPATQLPIGDHPDLRRAIEANSTTVQQVQQDVSKIEHTQNKLDKRSEYQFEFSRWQADVTEAERAQRKPPRKPDRLQDLERALMLGEYE